MDTLDRGDHWFFIITPKGRCIWWGGNVFITVQLLWGTAKVDLLDLNGNVEVEGLEFLDIFIPMEVTHG